MKRMRLGFLIGSALLVASPAAAQICAGFPTVDRQLSFGGSLDFPDGGDQWGVEASYNAQGPFAIFGGMDVMSAEGSDESSEIFFAGLAMDLLTIDGGDGMDALSVCPTGRIGYSSFEGGNMITIPVGIGIGTTVQVAPSVPVMPYVIPQLVYSRVSLDDFDSASDTNFGIRAGALVGFGMFYVGPEIEHSFQDGADPLFGIRAGIRL